MVFFPKFFYEEYALSCLSLLPIAKGILTGLLPSK